MVNDCIFFTNIDTSIKTANGIRVIGDLLGFGTTVSILDNDFNLQTKRGQGVLLEGEFHNDTKADISYNDFTVDPIDFNSSDAFGIACMNGTKNNLTIHSNDLLGKLGRGAGTGIRFVFTMGDNIEISNNQMPPEFSTDFNVGFSSAMRTTEALNLKICGNSIADAATPFSFIGICSGTNFTENSMKGGGAQLLITNGSIGDQVHKGNKWTRKHLGVHSTHNAKCTPTANASLSPFTVHTEQTQRNPEPPPIYDYFSEFHPAAIEPDENDEWFSIDPLGVPSNACTVQLTLDDIKVDLLIAQGLLTTTALESAQIWMMELYLYNKLKKNPDMINLHPAFDNFLAMKSNTSVGQLYEVDKVLTSSRLINNNILNELEQLFTLVALLDEEILLSQELLLNSITPQETEWYFNIQQTNWKQKRGLDSLLFILNQEHKTEMRTRLQNALILNDVVTANEEYEINKKTINEISLISTINQGGQLSQNQINTLRLIANKCPLYAGFAVYQARNLMPKCIEHIYNDNTQNCYGELPSFQEVVLEFQEKNSLETLSTSKKIIPNPNDGHFMAILGDNPGGQMQIFDITGRPLKIIDFSQEQHQLKVNFNNKAGIYYCIIIFRDGRQTIEKMIITK